MPGRKAIRSATLAVFVLLVAALVWAALLTRPTDPIHRGRHLSQWLADLDAGVPFASREEAREEAREAVAEIGADAIPLLLQYASADEHSFAYRMEERWCKLTGREPSHPVFLRSLAVLGFRVLGRQAVSATNELQALMLDGNVGHDAARSLGALRLPETLPLFTNLLSEAEPRRVTVGLIGIWEMGVQARELSPRLRELTEHAKDEWVRANALEALSKTGDAAMVLPVVLSRLEEDSSDNVRICAAFVLGNVDGDREIVKEALSNAISGDVSYKVRGVAGSSLKKLSASQASP